MHKQILGLSQMTKDLFLHWSWPGNVRELKNAIEGAVAVARGERLTVEDMEEILAGRLGGRENEPAPEEDEDA